MTIPLAHSFNNIIQSISLIMLVIHAVLNVIFAGAVAKDGGEITKAGFHTQIVSPMTWAFATLIGGVFVAAVYWLIHHAKLTRK